MRKMYVINTVKHITSIENNVILYALAHKQTMWSDRQVKAT